MAASQVPRNEPIGKRPVYIVQLGKPYHVLWTLRYSQFFFHGVVLFLHEIGHDRKPIISILQLHANLALGDSHVVMELQHPLEHKVFVHE
jgi:hypothetical protein